MRDERVMRTVEFLDYHATHCPHCGEEIFIPMYRQRPGTIEDLRKHKDEVMEIIERERREAKEKKRELAKP